MLKKVICLMSLSIALSGCTREVYLQAVPCEDCKPCPCDNAQTGDCCPETAMQTEIQVYQLEDVTPAPACGQVAAPRNCRKVCRQVEITE
jgi:hypothetical protein